MTPTTLVCIIVGPIAFVALAIFCLSYVIMHWNHHCTKHGWSAQAVCLECEQDYYNKYK